MSKSNRLKRRRRAREEQERNSNQAPKPEKENIFWTGTKKLYAIGTVVFGIIGWFALRDNIHKWTTSDHDLFIEETTIPYLLIPDELLRNNGKICFAFGNAISVCNTVDAFRTSFYTLPSSAIINCGSAMYPIQVGFKVDGNKLYVITDIKDLDNDQSIIKIDSNKCSLYRKNLKDYHPDENNHRFIEVVDNAGDTAFSIGFKKSNMIYIKGYFVGIDEATVVTEKAIYPCLNKVAPNWRIEVRKRMKDIQ